ncbi:MAG: hypothetical protein GF355_06775, partial [Candidatus Eisenbacteria bacterium]|nr:hypothetical protein [Candidatus Eisenbacteria bacterium]
MASALEFPIDPAGVKALLLDLDGVVYQDNRLITGAKKALQMLRGQNRPAVFVTNTTSRSRRLIWEQLRGLGISAAQEDILNAPRLAAQLLRREKIDRCLLLAPETCHEDFVDLDIDPQS